MNLTYKLRISSLCLAAVWGIAGAVAAPSYNLDISIQPADSGTYHVEPNMDSYPEGIVVTVYAAAYEGYQFAGWEGDITAAEAELVLVMTADTELTAVFEEAPEDDSLRLLVEVDPQGAGYISIDPAKESYTVGDQVTLTAMPNEGWAFSGWSGDVAGRADLLEPTLDLTMGEDTSVVAEFEAAQTVADDDQGASGGGACGVVGVLLWPMLAVPLGLVLLRRL